MADQKSYDYRVMVPELPGPAQVQAGDQSIRFRSLGTFKGRTPEAAVEKAAEDCKFEGSAVAVALSNWHERVVVVETVRQVTALKKGAVADPEPELEVGDGAAGDVIDESLDPDAACETEDCGHLPRRHGSYGLGICRVKDCPCGAYTAPKGD